MLSDIILHVYHSIHSILAISGVIFNAYLIYLAFYKTPSVIKVYVTLVLNFAITDFFACFFEFFVQQRVIPNGRTLAYISSGLCSQFGPRTCYTAYSLMLHFFAHSLWSLLMSFSYRYYILFHPSPSRRTIVVILILLYIPSTVQWISFLWAQDDPAIIEQILRVKFPDYDLDNKTITGTIDTFCFSAMFTILHMVLPVTPVYIAILILRKKIINTLTCQGNAMAKETKAMHTQLLRALTYQACLPCFFWFGIASYILGQFDIYHHPAVESFIFVCMVFIPVLSPISSFIFVKPYHNAILDLFRVNRKKRTAPRGTNETTRDVSVFQTTAHSSNTWNT
ncbi:unnamed protein product [Caenorhabditis angaria]|uniref:G-protein coupled receptors family 1 profile domain-containing protein n=1 Tax=Caenorhabditis angaria TaxID=860376 RepID=A0A9P1IQC5_9PELO|nr:unnamed protein product [Caenorhabditis angaria]